MKKTLITIAFLVAFCNLFAELVVVSNDKTAYVVEKNNIVSIEPIIDENLFYSKRQKRIIYMDYPKSWQAQEGLKNGNLTPVKNKTKIRFKNEANTQVAIAGAAVVGAGDATNKYEGNFIILDMPIDEVVEKLNIKK